MDHQVRLAIRGVYDMQKMRIQMGNRLVATFRSKLGLASSEKEENDKDAEKTLDTIRLCYKKLTDGVTKQIRLKNFKGEGIIDSFTEFTLVENYMNMEASEEQAFKRLKSIVEDTELWKQFLVDVKGCGPAMAGVILSEFDIVKAEKPSAFHKYAGLDVIHVEDEESGEIIGIGRNNHKKYMSEVSYIDKNGEEKTKLTLGYNPWLKTKLLGVLATCMIKAKGEYYDIYIGYKNRLENHPVHSSKTPAHRNRMAMRYMIKIFLINLHMKWREIEKLPVSVPYHEAKLGIVHGQTSGSVSVSGKVRNFKVE